MVEKKGSGKMKKNKKRFGVFALAALTLVSTLVLSACGNGSESKEAGKDKTITVLVESEVLLRRSLIVLLMLSKRKQVIR